MSFLVGLGVGIVLGWIGHAKREPLLAWVVTWFRSRGEG